MHRCAGTGVSLRTALRPGWRWFARPAPPAREPSLQDTGRGPAGPRGWTCLLAAWDPHTGTPASLACWPRVPALQAQGWARACQRADMGSSDGQHRQVSRALRTPSPPPLAPPCALLRTSLWSPARPRHPEGSWLSGHGPGRPPPRQRLCPLTSRGAVQAGRRPARIPPAGSAAEPRLEAASPAGNGVQLGGRVLRLLPDAPPRGWTRPESGPWPLEHLRDTDPWTLDRGLPKALALSLAQAPRLSKPLGCPFLPPTPQEHRSAGEVGV